MNGWMYKDEHIQVANIPKHKKPVLMIGNGMVMQKIGSFDSEEDAEVFCAILNKWLGIDGRGENGNL